MFSAKLRLFVGLVVVAGIVGCSGTGGDRPKTEKATGTVTYKGAPVEGAIVTFVPDGADKTAAVGKTDATGKFTLMTFEPGDGAAIGSYKVTVSKTDAPAAPAVAVAAGATEQEKLDAQYAAAEKAGVDAMGGGGAATPAPKDLLPAKYKSAASSGLVANVTADGKNEFTFALED